MWWIMMAPLFNWCMEVWVERHSCKLTIYKHVSLAHFAMDFFLFFGLLSLTLLRHHHKVLFRFVIHVFPPNLARDIYETWKLFGIYIYYISVWVCRPYNSQTETLHGLCPAMGFFLQFASFLCPLDSNPWPRGQYRSVLENAGGNWTVYIYIYGHCL